MSKLLTVPPQILKCINSYIARRWFHQDQVAERLLETCHSTKNVDNRIDLQ